jgi:predicted GNAT family acetyltransferase
MKPDPQASADSARPLNNEADARYELIAEGELAAFAEYQREGDAVRFTHTQVQAPFEGQGFGARLAAYALDDVRSQGLKAIPQCSFIASYVARHEMEYADLVPRD